MADNGDTPLSEQAQSAGIVFAFICGMGAYVANDVGAGILGAIAGYAAGRLFVLIFHTAKAFIISGIILLILVMLFAANLDRIGAALG